MNNQKLVSVIIPHFNHGEFIEEAIQSVYESEYKNIEVIVIDDDSNDAFSIEKLNSLKNKFSDLIILNQANAGPSVAKNKGAEISEGEYLFFLDADNAVMPSYIKDAVNILNENDNIDVVYSDYECFGDKTNIHISGEFDKYKLLFSNSIDNCVLIRKNTFIAVGGFDRNLSKMGLEDWELWINLIKNNYSFYYHKKLGFKYRVINTSRTEVSANQKIDDIKKYVISKHWNYYLELYESIYYSQKQLLETPDYRIGNTLLKPYRLIKSTKN